MVARRSSLLLVGLVILTLTLSGCLTGGGGTQKEQTVTESFAEMSTAFESLKAERIADVIDLPIVFEFDEFTIAVMDTGEEPPRIEVTRDAFIDILGVPLSIARAGGAELVFEIREPEDGEIDIAYEDNYAFVSNAELYIELQISQATMEDVFEKVLVNLMNWFIEELDIEIDEELLEEFEDLDQYLDEYAHLVWESIEGLILDNYDGEWPEVFEGSIDAEFILKKVNGKWKLSADFSDVFLPLLAL
jgi:hypothetical protein